VHWHHHVDLADAEWALKIGPKEKLPLKPPPKGSRCRHAWARALATAPVPASYSGLRITCMGGAWHVQACTLPLGLCC